jgi:hypothetical protein
METEGSEGAQEEGSAGLMTELSMGRRGEETGQISRRQSECQTDGQGTRTECEGRQETTIVLLEYKEGRDNIYWVYIDKTI